MTLNFYYSLQNKVFKLVNIDAEDLPASLERNIDTWKNDLAEKINITFWRNGAMSVKNPHRYNRVGVHYTVEGVRYSKYYFGINELINKEELTFGERL